MLMVLHALRCRPLPRVRPRPEDGAVNGPELERRARARRFVNTLRDELVLLLGEEHRGEIEGMTVRDLIRLKGRTMAELMAAPRP